LQEADKSPVVKVAKRDSTLVSRSDNGPEFVSLALLHWATDKGLRNLLVEPGKPCQNGYNRSFNCIFRDECLEMKWFYSRAHAKVIFEAWRQHYNLDYKTPLEFMSECGNEPNQQSQSF
jgi:putative transposase